MLGGYQAVLSCLLPLSCYWKMKRGTSHNPFHVAKYFFVIISENSCILLIGNDKYFISFLTTCCCLFRYKSHFELLSLNISNNDLLKQIFRHNLAKWQMMYSL